MATRTPVADRLTEFSLQVVWSGLLLGDDGAAYGRTEFQDRTFQVTGTFGGATIALQGSNDNKTWFGLTNSTGAALSYTAAGGGAAREGTRYVRPVVTGGDGTTSLVVTAVMVSRTAARGNVISDPLKLDVAGGTLTGPLLVASGVNIATLQGGATGEPVVVGAAPTSGDTDVGLVLETKGTGALMTAVPDSAATGGNVRGANAVDWQSSRSAATQVASGAGATIAGGTLNTASGSGATVIGGTGNTASGLEATAGGGAAQASAVRAFAYGNNALSDGWYSCAWGNFPWARGWYGADVHSAGRFSTTGDAQRSSHVLRGRAVAAAAVRLTANGVGAPASDTIINLANNIAVSGVVHVTARDTSTANCARWAIPFGMARATGVGSTTLVAGTVDFQNIIGAAAASGNLSITADTVNGGINLTFTPPNANTWNVVAAIHIAEVQ